MSTIPASNVEHVTFCARSPPVETIRQYLLTVICLHLLTVICLPVTCSTFDAGIMVDMVSSAALWSA